jgi:hypothetical protein
MTKRYVIVFILILLKNMNKKVNHSRFRKYPEVGPVPEASVAPFPRLDIVSVWAI